MATRKVPVSPQTGRPGQLDSQLVELSSRIVGLQEFGPHMGASTVLGPALSWAGTMTTTTFHLLRGYHRPFKSKWIAFSADHPGTPATADGVRFGVYRALRSELADGSTILRLMAKTDYVAVGAAPDDYLVELEREVTINTEDLFFVAAHSNPAGAGVDIYGWYQYATKMPGQFGISDSDLPGEVSTADVLPGSVDAGAPALSVLEDSHAPAANGRHIPAIHLLSRTARRLSWPNA